MNLMSKWGDNQIGAAWLKNSKNAKYLSGYVEIDGKKHPITLFKNSYKTEKAHPDNLIYKPFK